MARPLGEECHNAWVWILLTADTRVYPSFSEDRASCNSSQPLGALAVRQAPF